GGVEMYIQSQPQLAGRTFREALFLYDTSTLMGVVTADEQILLPPALDYTIQPTDQVIAISEDDDTVVLDGKQLNLDGLVTASPKQQLRHRERTLVLGASDRLGLVLRELDSYVSPGSSTLVLGEGEALAAIDGMVLELKNQTVERQLGDITARNLLDGL